MFAPWAFFLGGHFHPYPYWQGWGTLHTSKQGDYVVYVQFTPTPTGAHSNGDPYMTGNGYLCTPQGERFWMHVNASMSKGIGIRPDGKKVGIGMYYWPALTGGFIADHRPSLNFRGQWQGETILLDDNKSITNALQPDGSVYRGHDPNRPDGTEDIKFTIVQGTYSDFNAACAALRH